LIESVLKEDWNYHGKQAEVEKSLDLKGVYPRWLGFANLSRTVGNKTIGINSIFYLGNSKKEVELGVAKGFPQVVLNENETIIAQEYLKFFGFDDKHIKPREELHDDNLKLNLTFDVLAFLLSGAQESAFHELMFKNTSKTEIINAEGKKVQMTKG